MGSTHISQSVRRARVPGTRLTKHLIWTSFLNKYHLMVFMTTRGVYLMVYLTDNKFDIDLLSSEETSYHVYVHYSTDICLE